MHFNILNIFYFSFYFEKKTNRIGYSEKIKLNVISRLTSVTPSCGLVTMAWATVRLKKDNDYDDDDIYIMMSVCLFVCNEKSSLPPGSLL